MPEILPNNPLTTPDLASRLSSNRSSSAPAPGSAQAPVRIAPAAAGGSGGSGDPEIDAMMSQIAQLATELPAPGASVAPPGTDPMTAKPAAPAAPVAAPAMPEATSNEVTDRKDPTFRYRVTPAGFELVKGQDADVEAISPSSRYYATIYEEVAAQRPDLVASLPKPTPRAPLANASVFAASPAKPAAPAAPASPAMPAPGQVPKTAAPMQAALPASPASPSSPASPAGLRSSTVTSAERAWKPEAPNLALPAAPGGFGGTANKDRDIDAAEAGYTKTLYDRATAAMADAGQPAPATPRAMIDWLLNHVPEAHLYLDTSTGLRSSIEAEGLSVGGRNTAADMQKLKPALEAIEQGQLRIPQAAAPELLTPGVRQATIGPEAGRAPGRSAI